MPPSYIRVTDGSEETPGNLIVGMLRCLHDANPDLLHLYSGVVHWYLEINDGLVTREIGFDEDLKAVVIGPLGRNPGLWTSLRLGFDDRNGVPVYKATFERHWREVYDALAPTVPAKAEEPIREVNSASDLLGLWGDGDGDLGLAFLADGSGFFAAYNYTLMFYDVFKWELHRNSQLTIRSEATHSLDGGKLVSFPSKFQHERIPVQIQTRYTSRGSPQEVLLAPLENEQFNWISNEYIRCDIPANAIKFPCFLET